LLWAVVTSEALRQSRAILATDRQRLDEARGSILEAAANLRRVVDAF